MIDQDVKQRAGRWWLSFFCLWGSLTGSAFVFAEPVKPGDDDPPGVDVLYVPESELPQLMRLGQPGVLLPVEAFYELWREAHDNAQKSPDENPLRITHVDYTARVQGKQLLMTAVCQLRGQYSGWGSLEMPPLRGWTIESAMTKSGSESDQPALLTQVDLPHTSSILKADDGSGTPVYATSYVLLAEATSELTLTMELSMPLQMSSDQLQARCELLPTAASTLAIVLPAGMSVTIPKQGAQPELVFPAPGNASGENLGSQQTFNVSLGSRQMVDLQFGRVSEARQQAGIALVESTVGIHFSPAGASWVSQSKLDFSGQSKQEITCAIPAGLDIVSVEASSLAGWAVSEDQQLTLSFRQPQVDACQFQLRGILATSFDAQAARQSLSVSGFVFADVLSHTGIVRIKTPENSRLVLVDHSGMHPETSHIASRATGMALAPELGTGPGDAFDLVYWHQDYSLEATLSLKPRSVSVAQTTVLNLTESAASLRAVAEIKTRFAPLFQVDVLVPADWQISQVTLNRGAVAWSVREIDDGQRSLFIDLPRPLAAGQSLQLMIEAQPGALNWPPGNDAVTFPIPKLTMQNVDVLEGAYAITGSRDLEIVSSQMAGLSPSPLGIASERFGFRYQQPEIGGELAVRFKRAHLSAMLLSVYRLDEQTLEAWYDITLTIEQRGLQELEIRLPESVGTQVRFVSLHPEIKVQQQSDGPLEQGRRPFFVTFNRRYQGELKLQAHVRMPKPSLGDRTLVELPELTIPAADRFWGYLAMLADDDQQLTLTATNAGGAALASIDRVELPGSNLLEDSRVVWAARFTTPGTKAQVSEERFERVELPSAICQLARLETVLDPDQQAQHLASFTLLTAGVQSLRVELPPAAKVWAIFMNGRPVESRQVEGGGVLIPLSGIESSQTQAMSCELHYATDQESAATGVLSQSYVAQVPLLSIVDGQGGLQLLEILKQEWTVHTPDRYQLAGGAGDFYVTSSSGHMPHLFERLVGMLDPARGGEYWVRGLVLGGALLVVMVVMPWLAKVWFEQPSRLAVGCLGVVCLLLIVALMLPATQSARHAARSEAERASTLSSAPEPAQSSPADYTQMPRAQFESDDRLRDSELILRQSEVNEETVRRSNNGVEIGGQLDVDADNGRTARPEFGYGLIQDKRQLLEGSNDPAWGMAITQTPIGQPGPPSQPGPQAIGATAPTSSQIAAGGEVLLAGSAGGLLSVPVKLQVPARYQTHRFAYEGVKGGAEPFVLEAHLHQLLLLRVVMAIVMAGTALVLWLLRRTSFATRWALFFTGLMVSLGLAVIEVPLVSSICLGLFFGTLLGIGLWFTAGCCAWAQRRLLRLSRRSRSAVPTSALALVIAITATSSVFAEETTLSQACQPRPGVTQIIVPYDTSGGLDPQINQVYLSREEYLKLHEKAKLPLAIAPATGVRYSILQAAYDLPLSQMMTNHLDADGGSGQIDAFPLNARLLVHVFDPSVSASSPLEIPLPFEQITLSTARLDDQPATIRISDDGQKLMLLLNRPGKHVLDLKATLAGSLDRSGGRLQAVFYPVTSGLVSVSLPKDRYQVRLNQQDNTFRVKRDGDVETYLIGVSRGGPFSLTLDLQRDQTAQRRIVDAQGAHRYRLREALLELTSTYRLNVRQGELLEVPIQLSEGLQLKSVTGADLAGWAFEAGATQGILYLRGAVSEQTDLTLTSYLALPRDDEFTFALPNVSLPGVTRESGRWLLLEHDYLKITRVEAGSGLTQIEYDSTQWPGESAGDRQRVFACYRNVGPPASATLTLVRQQANFQVTSQHGVQVHKDRLRVASSMKIDVGSLPVRQLSVTVPFGALVLDASAAQLDDWVEDADFGELKLFFATPQSGLISLQLELQSTRDPSEPLVALDLPRVVGASASEASVGFWLQGGYSGVMVAYAGWSPIAPHELPSEMKQLSTQSADFAFRTRQTEPDFVTLTLQQAAVVAACDGLVLTAVSDTAIDHGLTLRWQIRQSATDQLDCLVSSEISEALEWQGPGIREVRQSPGPDGKTRWTILLHQPVSQNYVLTGTASLPFPQDQNVMMPKIEFVQQKAEDPDQFVSITSQTSFGVLVNLSDDQVLPLRPELLDTIPADELPLTVQPQLIQQASEILRLRPQGDELVWQIRRGVVQRVAQASVNDAALVTHFSADGSWRTTATYTIKNISRQFLPLELPAEATLLSIQVDGKAARAVRTELQGRPVVLVPLLATSEAEVSFEAKIIMQGRLAAALPRADAPGLMSISVPVVQVVTPQDSPEFGIPVAYTRWNVILPDGYHARVLRRPDQTNLVETTLASSQTKYLSGLLAEFEEFNRYASDISVGSKLRYEAVDNQKELAERITKAQSELRSRGANMPDAQELVQLQAKAGQAFDTYGRNSASLARQQQQAQSGEAGSKPASGRNLVEMNNEFFITQNQIPTAKDADGSFRFGTVLSEVIESKSQEKSVRKKDENSERSQLSTNFERQNRFLSESLASPTPSGKPDMPKIPAGGPASLESHIIRNNTSVDLGKSVDDMLVDVPAPVSEFQTLTDRVRTIPMAPSTRSLAHTAKGLSFLIDLPSDDPTLALIKVGGQPQLTIQVSTPATAGLLLKIIWGVGLLVSLVSLLIGIRHLDHSGVMPAQARLGLMLLASLLIVLTEGWLMLLGVVLLLAVMILQLRAMLVERLSLTA